MVSVCQTLGLHASRLKIKSITGTLKEKGKVKNV